MTMNLARRLVRKIVAKHDHRVVESLQLVPAGPYVEPMTRRTDPSIRYRIETVPDRRTHEQPRPLGDHPDIVTALRTMRRLASTDRSMRLQVRNLMTGKIVGFLAPPLGSGAAREWARAIRAHNDRIGVAEAG
jgi:hypothetical protein